VGSKFGGMVGSMVLVAIVSGIIGWNVARDGPPDNPCEASFRLEVGNRGLQFRDCAAASAQVENGTWERRVVAHQIDVEPDGQPEVIAGAIDAAGAFDGFVFAQVDGDFRRIASIEVRPPSGTRAGISFACVDVDGDGQREFVEIEYEIVKGRTTEEPALSLSWKMTHLSSSAPAMATTEGVSVIENASDLASFTDGSCGAVIVQSVAED